MENSLMVVLSFWRKFEVEYVIKFVSDFFACMFVRFCHGLYLISSVLVDKLLLFENSLFASSMQGVDPSIRAEVWPFLLGV